MENRLRVVNLWQRGGPKFRIIDQVTHENLINPLIHTSVHKMIIQRLNLCISLNVADTNLVSRQDDSKISKLIHSYCWHLFSSIFIQYILHTNWYQDEIIKKFWNQEKKSHQSVKFEQILHFFFKQEKKRICRQAQKAYIYWQKSMYQKPVFKIIFDRRAYTKYIYEKGGIDVVIMSIKKSLICAYYHSHPIWASICFFLPLVAQPV